MLAVTPEMRPARMAPGWLIAATVALMFACGDMRQDELDCEEAVSHLQDCCPGFDSRRIECIYETGCTPQIPAISIQQSQCIRDESCSALVASGVCQRAQNAQTVTDSAQNSTPVSETVCP